jgi:hypothetical protein
MADITLPWIVEEEKGRGEKMKSIKPTINCIYPIAHIIVLKMLHKLTQVDMNQLCHRSIEHFWNIGDLRETTALLHRQWFVALLYETRRAESNDEMLRFEVLVKMRRCEIRNWQTHMGAHCKSSSTPTSMLAEIRS